MRGPADTAGVTCMCGTGLAGKMYCHPSALSYVPGWQTLGMQAPMHRHADDWTNLQQNSCCT